MRKHGIILLLFLALLTLALAAWADYPPGINYSSNGGKTWTVQGTLAVASGATFTSAVAPSYTAGLTVTGGTVNLNASSNNAVNVGTGTTTSAVTVGGTGTQTISVGNGAGVKTVNLGSATGASATAINSGTGDITADSTDDITITATDDFSLLVGSTNSILNIGTSAYATDLNIGNDTGATDVDITAGTGGVTLASTGTGDVTTDTSDDAIFAVADDVDFQIESAGGIFNANGTLGAVYTIGTDDSVADDIDIGSAKDDLDLEGEDITLDTADDADVAVADDFTVTMESAGGVFAVTGTAGLTVNIGTDDTVADSITIGSAKDAVTIGASSINSGGSGVASGTGVTSVEKGLGAIHQTTFTLTAVEVTITDPTGAAGYGGIKIYDFPAGWIYRTGVVADLAITAGAGGISDTFDGDVALGGTVSGGGGMAGDEVSWVASTATPQAVGGVATADCQSTATEMTIGDGHATDLDLYLNFEVDDADISAGDTLSVTGTITVTWIQLGDN